MTYINLDLECRVDKDADGKITEEEIKEVQYKIINSPLTVWPYFIWKKIDRQPWRCSCCMDQRKLQEEKNRYTTLG